MSSRVAELADYVNAHPNITVDVGQVMFGDAMAMTADGAAGTFCSKLYGGPLVQLRHRAGKRMRRHADRVPPQAASCTRCSGPSAWSGTCWSKNPWQVMMSTDHPNGGSFLAYPQIIRLLMDREFRREQLGRCPAAVRERTVLGELDREYTLEEIAIITRAGPARALGLAQKGIARHWRRRRRGTLPSRRRPASDVRAAAHGAQRR